MTAGAENADQVEARLHEMNAAPLRFGVVQGDRIVVDDHGKAPIANISLTDLRAAHESFFKNWMES